MMNNTNNKVVMYDLLKVLNGKKVCIYKEHSWFGDESIVLNFDYKEDDDTIRFRTPNGEYIINKENINSILCIDDICMIDAGKVILKIKVID